jgi:hypothetical protein
MVYHIRQTTVDYTAVAVIRMVRSPNGKLVTAVNHVMQPTNSLLKDATLFTSILSNFDTAPAYAYEHYDYE